MNNPKDIPLATGYIIALFYMIPFVKHFPTTTLANKILLALGIAFAISIRVGGAILIGYLFLFTIIKALHMSLIKKEKLNWFYAIGILIGISLLAYFVSLSVWPYGHTSPFKHPFYALKIFNKNPLWDGPVLFEGLVFKAPNLPWYYLPKWIVISSPVFIICSFFLLIVMLPKLRKQYGAGVILMLLFSALFPIVFIILYKSTVYDSWRHILFVYPPLVILLALSWECVFDTLKNKSLKWLTGTVLVFLMIEPLLWMIRNHPNEYVYFNPVTGGIKKAFSRYEIDYWGNSLRKASEWLVAYHKKYEPGRPIVVRADGNIMSSYCYLKSGLGMFYKPMGLQINFVETDHYSPIVYPPLSLDIDWSEEKWDYALALPRDWNSIERKMKWPPKGTIHEVKVDGVTICAVVKNPSSN